MAPTPSSPADFLERYAALRCDHLSELGDRRLVVPNGEDFPDPYTADLPSAERFLRRMQGHAGLSDIPMHLALAGGPAVTSSGCGTCAVPSAGDGPQLVDNGEEWLLVTSAPELAHPVALGARFARSLGGAFLVETRQDSEAGKAVLTEEAELAAIQLGLGGLLLQGAHVYQKSCGGPSIQSFASLSLNELALGTVIMAQVSGSPLRSLRRSLEATQREALDHAEYFVRGNQEVIYLLRECPEAILTGAYELSEGATALQAFVGRFLSPPAKPTLALPKARNSA